MGEPADSGESHSLRGVIDRAVLIEIRDVVAEQEPLANPTLDRFLDPTVLRIAIDAGLCAANSCRIDVRWTTRDDYAFHYSDSAGINVRWDRHPHGGMYVTVDGIAHYHPPPEASSVPEDVETSCIQLSQPILVTRAVLKLWREAYDAGSLSPLNELANPP